MVGFKEIVLVGSLIALIGCHSSDSSNSPSGAGGGGKTGGDSPVVTLGAPASPSTSSSDTSLFDLANSTGLILKVEDKTLFSLITQSVRSYVQGGKILSGAIDVVSGKPYCQIYANDKIRPDSDLSFRLDPATVNNSALGIPGRRVLTFDKVVVAECEGSDSSNVIKLSELRETLGKLVSLYTQVYLTKEHEKPNENIPAAPLYKYVDYVAHDMFHRDQSGYLDTNGLIWIAQINPSEPPKDLDFRLSYEPEKYCADMGARLPTLQEMRGLARDAWLFRMANKGPLPPNHPFANDDKYIRISDPSSDKFGDTTMMSILYSANYGRNSPPFRCVKPLEGTSPLPPKDIGPGDAHPRFSGVAVNLDGWPARMTPKQAFYFCDSLHGRLPTPREWAKFAMDNGAKGMSDSEKPGYIPIKEQDPRKIAFYMSMDGFVRPQIESPFAAVKDYMWTFFQMPSDTDITQNINGGVRDTWGYQVMSFDYDKKSFLSSITRPEDAYLTPMCTLY